MDIGGALEGCSALNTNIFRYNGGSVSVSMTKLYGFFKKYNFTVIGFLGSFQNSLSRLKMRIPTHSVVEDENAIDMEIIVFPFRPEALPFRVDTLVSVYMDPLSL